MYNEKNLVHTHFCSEHHVLSLEGCLFLIKFSLSGAKENWHGKKTQFEGANANANDVYWKAIKCSK